jgi:hypothetical protein
LALALAFAARFLAAGFAFLGAFGSTTL